MAAIGSGSTANLVHNCAGYVIQTAPAEVCTMGVKAGVDPLGLWKAVRQGAGGRRRTLDGLAGQFLPGRFEPAAFAVRLGHKGVTLAASPGRGHPGAQRPPEIPAREADAAAQPG